MGHVIDLRAEPRSVGQARRFCTATLRDWGAPPDLVSTCTLLVSELATNAVLHARTSFTVELTWDGCLHVEVADGDPHLPHHGSHRLDAASGRGMHLVEALSVASGAEVTSQGKRVWFELAWEGSNHSP